MLGNHDLLVADVILSWQVLGLLIENEALNVVFMRVVADGPLSVDDEVDFRHVTLLIQDKSVIGIVVKLAGHEAKSNLVDEI